MVTTQRRKGPPNKMGCIAQRRFDQLHVVTIAMELKGRFRYCYLVGEVRSS